ncbi:MAG: flagellin [Planctomycetota bacterium]|jgi:flagellin|nr:flagellin [Planctomycetota bacterium]
MGLRINSDGHGVLSSIRSLTENLSSLQKTQSKIASGLEIQKASDNPAGLVISELFLAQISGSEQALQNTQYATNFINTAEAGLSTVSDQLVDLQGLAVQASNSLLPDEALQAIQFQADQIVSSIDRIASSTSFGNTPLLNGQQAFTTSGLSANISNVNVQQATATDNAPLTVSVQVTQSATQAQALGTLTGGGGAASFSVGGTLGTEAINLQAGATVAQIESAINSVTDSTGVYASGGEVFSQNVGSNSFVNVDFLSGTVNGLTEGQTQGTDVQGTINGAAASGSGNDLSTAGPTFTGTVTLSSGTAPGSYTFDVTGGGATFQVGGGLLPSDQIQLGIDSVDSSVLGQTGGLGTLNSLISGGANSLTANPQNALSIVQSSLSEVNSQQASLGAVVSNQLQPSINSLSVAVENIAASQSTIRDTDIASALSEQVRNQILTQSSISALQQHQLHGESVLKLLQ